MTEEMKPAIQLFNLAGEQEAARSGMEVQSTALDARAKAEIQAPYIMALQKPRDLAVMEQKLLELCKKPEFAEAAEYNKPIGKGIVGLSVRFAETAMALYGNCRGTTSTISDGPESRTIRVAITDFETNNIQEKDVTFEKSMERSYIKKDQFIISKRKNSRGNDVFKVWAETDDDILAKEGALASKAFRVNALRILPAEIIKRAWDTIKQTKLSGVKENEKEAKDKLTDSFFELNITVEDLQEWLDHKIDKITPAEIVDLQGVFVAIRDDEATWADALAFRKVELGVDPEPKQGGEQGKSGVSGPQKETKGLASTKKRIEEQRAKAAAKKNGGTTPPQEPAKAEPKTEDPLPADPPKEDKPDPDASVIDLLNSAKTEDDLANIYTSPECAELNQTEKKKAAAIYNKRKKELENEAK